MRFEIMTVTPEMAQEWLKKNIPNNRSLGPAKGYTIDMKGGKWKLTHQAIAFSESGFLIDGQNRLTAIAKAGLAVQMAVAFDCPNDSFDVLDIGKGRTLGDALKIRGIANAKNAAAASIKIQKYEGGQNTVLNTYSIDAQQTVHGGGTNETRTSQIDFFEKNHAHIQDCAEFAQRVYSAAPARLVTQSDIATLYWIFGMSEAANEFLSKTIIGYNLERDGSHFHMRQVLEECKNKNRILTSAQLLKYWKLAWEKRNMPVKLLRVK
jgi:hypothetical protein